MVVPEKIGKVVAQVHSISRGSYYMPTNARRLIYAAMSVLIRSNNSDKEKLNVSFTTSELIKAFGLQRGGNTNEIIQAAVTNALSHVVSIEQENGSWEKFQWLSLAEFDAATDTFTICIHEELRPYLFILQRGFSNLALTDIGQLQGGHALRWYEMLMSRKNQADRHGHWFFEISVKELRVAFNIAPEEYSRTANLRRKLVDVPIAEINNSKMGFSVALEYLRKGRTLIGVRARCYPKKEEKDDWESRLKEQKDLEKENELWIEANRELFDKLFEEEKEQGHSLWTGDDMLRLSAIGRLKCHSKVKVPKKEKK